MVAQTCTELGWRHSGSNFSLSVFPPAFLLEGGVFAASGKNGAITITAHPLFEQTSAVGTPRRCSRGSRGLASYISDPQIPRVQLLIEPFSSVAQMCLCMVNLFIRIRRRDGRCAEVQRACQAPLHDSKTSFSFCPIISNRR